MPGPLAGLRVLELATMVSGPYGAMLLRQMGAEVVKVEPPGGDPMRGYTTTGDDRSSSFYNVNRGKRSVVVDLKHPDGAAVVRRVAGTADVVVENWRPGVAARLGVGLDDLREADPRLVTVAVRGFGDHGPYADGRAYDSVIQSVSGITPLQGTAEAPELVRTIIADKLTSVTWVQAALALLAKRGIAGEGGHATVSMIDAMVAFLWPDTGGALTFADVERDPMADPYRKQRAGSVAFAGDGRPFFCTSVSEREWAALCGVLDRPDWVERFGSVSLRVRNQEEIHAAVQERFGDVPRAEVLAVLREADVPAVPVNAPRDLLDDPHVRQTGLVRDVDRPGFGTVREAGPPWDFGDDEDIGPPPGLGDSTADVLAGCGFGSSEIEELTRSGVVA